VGKSKEQLSTKVVEATDKATDRKHTSSLLDKGTGLKIFVALVEEVTFTACMKAGAAGVM